MFGTRQGQLGGSGLAWNGLWNEMVSTALAGGAGVGERTTPDAWSGPLWRLSGFS